MTAPHATHEVIASRTKSEVETTTVDGKERKTYGWLHPMEIWTALEERRILRRAPKACRLCPSQNTHHTPRDSMALSDAPYMTYEHLLVAPYVRANRFEYPLDFGHFCAVDRARRRPRLK
jgi:hypothetical protein